MIRSLLGSSCVACKADVAEHAQRTKKKYRWRHEFNGINNNRGGCVECDWQTLAAVRVDGAVCYVAARTPCNVFGPYLVLGVTREKLGCSRRALPVAGGDGDVSPKIYELTSQRARVSDSK